MKEDLNLELTMDSIKLLRSYTDLYIATFLKNIKDNKEIYINVILSNEFFYFKIKNVDDDKLFISLDRASCKVFTLLHLFYLIDKCKLINDHEIKTIKMFKECNNYNFGIKIEKDIWNQDLEVIYHIITPYETIINNIADAHETLTINISTFIKLLYISLTWNKKVLESCKPHIEENVIYSFNSPIKII